jgi:CubicO group peptidase (beta-lactamase class C family)
VIISINLFASTNEKDTIPKSKISDYQVLIEKMIEKNNIKGTSVALFDNDSILWAESFGFLNSEKKQAINVESIFSIQSISKTLTATGVLFAVRDGLVDLDKPIIEYLPDFKVNSCFEKNPEKKITLRLLLSHIAGFTHEAPVGNNFDASFKSYELHYQSISDTWLKFPVGSDYSYSNLGYDLAAKIIEKVSGMPFSLYMNKKLFEPLSMNSATLDANEILTNKNRAEGNDPNFEGIPIISPLIGSGGVYINAVDLATFVQFHLNGGKFHGKQILDKNILLEMYTPVINNHHSYALGVSEFESNGTFCMNHNGGGFGFGASMIWFPEYNFGCVILTNLGFSGVYDVNSKICSDLINSGLVKKDTNSIVFNPIHYFDALKKNAKLKLKSYCVGDSIYKPDWEKYLGTYKVKVGGGKKYRSSKNIPSIEVYKKNNGLFFGNDRLIEYQRGLFFTADGEVLDFRTKKITFRNIELEKKER